MTSRRLRILQIFNRYQTYGGEEGSVYRIRDALQELCEVELLLSSTAEMTSRSLLRKAMLPWNSLHNSAISARLDALQKSREFDAWQIHNIFPVMSPVVYEKALAKQVPIVHYLHNYRLSCVNGFFLNHGQPCQKCLSGNFWPAFQTGCWHDSRLKSGWVGLITHRVRQLPLFEKVFQWVAISEAVKQEYVRMGVPEERIRVIHHFLEDSGAPMPPSRSPTALFVGRLSEEKGVAKLLDAWRLIAGGDRRLLIVGDGPERANLERQARGLPGVHFLGYAERTQLKPYRQQALFSVVPSIWREAFGMTVLESWAVGRPVVAHRIGALPELIQDGKNGLLVDAGSTADLAEKMDLLFSHPEQAHALGLQGWNDLKTRFSLKAWLPKIIEVYRELQVG